MIRRRSAIGLGLGTLLAIGAASTALDIKSRHDAGWVDHTLEVLQKTSDLRLLLRQAEGASRGFAVTHAPRFVDEFQTTSNKIPPAFADLRQAVIDNPTQLERLDSRSASGHAPDRAVSRTDPPLCSIRPTRHRSAGGQSRRPCRHDDDLGAPRRFHGRRAAAARSALRRLANDRLAVAGDRSGRPGAHPADRGPSDPPRLSVRPHAAVLPGPVEGRGQRARSATLEQRDHLVAAHEELRRSSAVLENTFNSMAEGVLVLDPNGTVVLANQAAREFPGNDAPARP